MREVPDYDETLEEEAERLTTPVPVHNHWKNVMDGKANAKTDLEAEVFIKKWCKEVTFGDDSCLFIDRLLDRGLSKIQVVTVLRTLGDTCNECWNATKPCYCSPAFDE